jgi:hypothetical protein
VNHSFRAAAQQCSLPKASRAKSTDFGDEPVSRKLANQSPEIRLAKLGKSDFGAGEMGLFAGFEGGEMKGQRRAQKS